MSIKEKLLSRKFWISCAAFLSSVAASITGFQTDNENIVIAGVVCATLSAAIYAGCEAAVDKACATVYVDDEIEVEETAESDEE